MAGTVGIQGPIWVLLRSPGHSWEPRVPASAGGKQLRLGVGVVLELGVKVRVRVEVWGSSCGGSGGQCVVGMGVVMWWV